MGKHSTAMFEPPEPWRPPGTPQPPTTGTYATGGYIAGPAIPLRAGYGYPERFISGGVISSNPRWQKVLEELNKPGPDLAKAREESAHVRDTVLGQEVHELRRALDDRIGQVNRLATHRDRWERMFNVAIDQRDKYRAALERANDAIEDMQSRLETTRHERDSNDDLLIYLHETDD